MSSSAFVFVLSIGSALLALWVHARFPKLAPEHVGKTLLHTGLAFALLRLSPGMVESPVMAIDHDRRARRSGTQLRTAVLDLDAEACPDRDGRLALDSSRRAPARRRA